MKYQIPATVFIQEIDEEVILLDTQTQEYFSLNEVGKYILDLIAKDFSQEEIIEDLSTLYKEIDKTQVENDFLNFIKILGEKGLIISD